VNYRLAYFIEAREDISAAKNWYFGQLPGLEVRFAKDVKRAIERLRSTPFSHSIRYKNIRIAHPDVFPYSIHYYIDEDMKRIVIIGVVHSRRDLAFLDERTSR
jgi:hypothetical protein